MASKPLPPIATDPSITAGQAIHAAFPGTVSAIRGNPDLSDLAQAEKITAAWEVANVELSRLYVNLQERRRARLSDVEALVPSGPNVPAGASPADAALLRQLFRQALTEARMASAGERAAMLADAEQYDDDILRRASLTAMSESGDYDDQRAVAAWAETNGVASEWAEIASLRDGLAGRNFDNLTVVQALGQISPPAEVAQLPRFRELAAAGRATLQTQGRTIGYYPAVSA